MSLQGVLVNFLDEENVTEDKFVPAGVQMRARLEVTLIFRERPWLVSDKSGRGKLVSEQGKIHHSSGLLGY